MIKILWWILFYALIVLSFALLVFAISGIFLIFKRGLINIVVGILMTYSGFMLSVVVLCLDTVIATEYLKL